MITAEAMFRHMVCRSSFSNFSRISLESLEISFSFFHFYLSYLPVIHSVIESFQPTNGKVQSESPPMKGTEETLEEGMLRHVMI